MKKDVVAVEIRGILPANSGCAIFVGNEEKVFVIQVENNMGAVIGMFLRDTHNDLGRKIVEIVARPSDCIALATALKKPMYVSSSLFEQVEDISEVVESINENGGEA